MEAREDSLGDQMLDKRLAGVTPDDLAKALKGFPLPLVSGRDMDWLALAVRRSLAVSMDNVSDGPDRRSNAVVRHELKRLSKLTGATWKELFSCDEAADDHIWNHAWKRSGGTGGKDVGNGLSLGEPPDYLRFRAAVAELDWVSSLLRGAANSTASQGGQWANSERKRKRVERGRYLAPVYEAAFGKKVTANNYGNGDARFTRPTPFMDFYERIVVIAFGRDEITGLSENVKQACQRHRHDPVQFRAGLIPRL